MQQTDLKSFASIFIQLMFSLKVEDSIELKDRKHYSFFEEWCVSI